MVFGWTVPIRELHPELRLRSRVDLALIAIAVALCTVYVFSTPPGSAISLLQLPFVLAALLVFAAFRLPPRWAASLALMSVFIAAGMASWRTGPFVVADPFLRLVQVQTFLAALAIIPYMFTIFLAEMSIAVNRLVESESRYRNFIEHSNEAVWRVELEQPMPVSLPLEEQRKWLAKVRACSGMQSFLHEPGSARNDIRAAAMAPRNSGMRFTNSIWTRRHASNIQWMGCVLMSCRRAGAAPSSLRLRA